MKTCFVSIIGRPNVGKSSLLNKILNYNLSIVTPKAQTTRDKINGIYNDSEYQIVFTDTPGIHKTQQKLGESLNASSYEAIKESDLVLFLTPENETIAKGDLMIIDKLKKIKNKIAIITKVDLIEEKNELDTKASFLKSLGFNSVLGVSINYQRTIDELMEEIKKYAIESNLFFDPEEITDKSMSFIAKEIIRKNAIQLLDYELPHNIAVVIDNFSEEEDKYIIDAIIYVSKDSQKGILIGKNGSMIKKIGINARKEIALTFDMPIVLNTRVKVSKKWNDDEKSIKRMGY
ncbi:GTPase Era [Mesomycoplasma neurolyticum]|uniref:GTPase Era n=1 Tax=Mesomycoplasma neurolyticum TaxID=2120 RepID=A0A449A4U5_9BACT|nr:GTPase Era [Mesomycoplasma neurolyticum]VEU59234.1 GTP-binding protein [Mesomycoplasma neurolyticum]